MYDLQVDADGDLTAAQHEADDRYEKMLLQQEMASTAMSTDAAAAGSVDGSPETAANEDAEEEPPTEEEPSGREGSTAFKSETRAAAADADDEDDVRALEEAATGGMAEDESEQPPADEDENEQPQPSATDAEATDAAQGATIAQAPDGGSAEPNVDGVEISDSANVVANGEPADGDQGPEEDHNELLAPLSDSAADAVPQTEAEQPEAAADGMPDADAAPAEGEPSAGIAASVDDDVGSTAVAAVEDAAADGDAAPDASVPEDGEAAAPVKPKRAVPAWRRAHDSADTGDGASANDTPHGISESRSIFCTPLTATSMGHLQARGCEVTELRVSLQTPSPGRQTTAHRRRLSSSSTVIGSRRRHPRRSRSLLQVLHWQSRLLLGT